MSDDGTGDLLARVRREPPPFRRVTVASVDDLTPHTRRVVLAGRELEGFTIDAPGSSVRLLLPPRGPVRAAGPALLVRDHGLVRGGLARGHGVVTDPVPVPAHLTWAVRR